MDQDFSQIPIDDAEFCVFDFETTGLSASNHKIIEIGMVKVSSSGIKDKFHTLVNPGRSVPYYISAFTGITTDDVFDAPYFEEVAQNVCSFMSGSIITAHNFSFDNAFLRKELIECGMERLTNPGLCTLRIARRLYPMLRSRSLSSVSRHLNLVNHNAHRALDDAEVTAKILIKMIKELKDSQGIKTVGDLLNFQFIPKQDERKIKVKQKLNNDVISLPHCPGVYYFLNSKNDIIYIGKAKSLRDRVRSYFSTSAPSKARKIIQQASRLKIEITNTELVALLSEAEMIKIINPKHNRQLKEYGNKYFLKIGSSEEYPSLSISSRFDFDGNDYFGLFITRAKAVTVLEIINKTFAIRECTDKEFQKKKVCFLAEIERCTAPCINDVSNTYREELEKVYEFLYGKNQFALNRLIYKMKDYSEKLKFEKAAEMKQVIDLLLAQTHKSSLLAEPVNAANVLIETDEGFGKDYILMLAG